MEPDSGPLRRKMRKKVTGRTSARKPGKPPRPLERNTIGKPRNPKLKLERPAGSKPRPGVPQRMRNQPQAKLTFLDIAKKVVGEGGSPKLKTDQDRYNRIVNTLTGSVRNRPGDFAMKKTGGVMKKMLTGGQSKIAAKAPPTNKIDEKDFAVLRAEKAKGRGQGLQDEKMKPGKVMKARRGRFTKDQKKKYPGLAKAGSVNEFLKRRKQLSGTGTFGFSEKMKAQEQGLIDKKTGKGRADLMKRAKSVKFGKRLLIPIAIGIAGVQALKSKMKKKKEEPKKKMGGGMMKKYAEGGLTAPEQARRKASPSLGQMARKIKGKEDSSVTLAKFMKSKVDALNESVTAGGMKRERVTQGSRKRRKEDFIKDVAAGKYKKPNKDAAYYKSIGLTGERGDKAVKGFFAPKKYMGGGMMQRPMGMMKKGQMVKARGGGMARTKPTKMF